MVTTTSLCVRYRSEIRCIPSEIKSVLAKNRVGLFSTMKYIRAERLSQDIYIVADAEGNEMVLKLHRCSHSLMSHECTHMNIYQTWPDIFPCNQRKERLFGQTKVSFVDVHVAPGCTKRMGVHEGMVIECSRNTTSL